MTKITSFGIFCAAYVFCIFTSQIGIFLHKLYYFVMISIVLIQICKLRNSPRLCVYNRSINFKRKMRKTSNKIPVEKQTIVIVKNNCDFKQKKHQKNIFYNNIDFLIYRKLRPEDLIQYTITEKKDKRVAKAHVNSVFFRQLRELLRKSFYFLYLFLN